MALAAAAPYAAPSSALLPAPAGGAPYVAAVLALLAAFAVGYAAPFGAFLGLVVLVVAEGAIRKWVVNDITVFMVKDFLAAGIYARVLPSLTRDEWRRPRWLLAPVALLLLLAIVYCARSASLSQAVIGLRSYAMYVPFLWVAPKLLSDRARTLAVLLLVLGVGVFEAVLGAVQALTADEWLNRVVPGVLPALVTIRGVAWLRPTGTLLQVGTYAAFMLVPVLVAFGLVMCYRRGRLYWIALGSLAVLMWGVIYASSRALSGTIALAAAILAAYLLWRRRFLSLVAVPAALLIGFLAVSYQPFLGGPVREGRDAYVLRNQAYTFAQPDGTIGSITITIHRGDASATRDFVGRAFGERQMGVKAGDLPAGRVRTQLGILADQGLIGHGTGAMSLGSQYLLPEREVAAESEHVRVAYELGWPGLIAFLWLLGAIWLAAAWGAFVALEWRRPLAVVALGTATLVPILTALTYAFQYPPIALLYYAFGGCAVAWATEGRRATRPIPTAPAAPRVATPSVPSRAPS